ncbi:hypothetical protein AN958_10728 [Leucoagaricus sp. SymC.cos]|nr:hypothetical protein AN958_10728 [Leucoagaricus sp. SymC.cos]
MDLQSGIHVPQELIDLITELLGHDSRSILKLCLVSCSFCASARSVLYHRIKVVNPTTYRLTRPSPQIVHLDNFTHFLMTIAIYNSGLGQYVHEIHYSPQNSSRPVGFWEVMNKALYSMTNLKIFSFRNFVSPSIRDLFWGTKFQLEEFYWDDGYDFDRDGEIAHFLRTQPGLKVLAAPLRLRESDPLVSLPVLPKLRTLIGDMGAIRRLICIHPIEKLRWRDSPPEVLYSGPNMKTLEASESLAKLRVPSIGATRPQSWWTTLTPYLRSLEVLHISGLHVRDFCQFQERIMIDGLGQTRTLKSFISNSAKFQS